MAGFFSVFDKIKQWTPGTSSGNQPQQQDQGEEPKKPVNLEDYAQDRQLVQAWLSTFQRAIRKRKDFLAEMDKVKSFYIVDALTKMIADDALTPDPESGEVFSISSEDKKVNTALEELQQRFDFDQIISDITPDLIKNGEYILKHTLEKDKGLTDISDTVDQSKVVAFYRFGYPYVFLTQGGKESRRSVKVDWPFRYSHFAINRFRLRIKVGSEFGVPTTDGKEEIPDLSDKKDFEGNPLPSYARIGRSIFYGVLSKIKELMLMEMLVPAKRLNDVLKGTLVGVSVPESSTPKDAFEACRTYERFLNKKVGLDRTGQDFSVQDIVSYAGTIKVLPLMGEKGEIRSLSDAKEDRTLEGIADRINDYREIVCSSIGVPSELLFASERGEPKSELLKRYSRYVRLLKNVQHALVIGVKQMCLTDLVNRGFQVGPDDINVTFRNQLVSIDALDKAEFEEAIISAVSNVIRAIDDLGRLEGDEYAGIVNGEKFKQYLFNKAKVFGDGNFINEPGSKEKKKEDVSD